MTHPALQKMVEAAEKATPGPWEVEPDERFERNPIDERYEEYLAGYDISSASGPVVTCEGIRSSDQDAANAAFIALANPANILSLAEYVRGLEEAAAFALSAMDALAAYEADYGDVLPGNHELGRIEDSRGSPSFRIRVDHIRRLAAALGGKP